ncbi:MAG: hypothetical protein M1830_006218, partial [Pleopsidium flavum]
VVVVTTMLIYARTGNEIYQKRRQLRNLSATRSFTAAENLHMSSKTTEIRVISQAADDTRKISRDDEGQSRESFQGPREYQKYTVNIESAGKARANKDDTFAESRAASNIDRAAWAYTKCALLFFAALLITWASHSISFIRQTANLIRLPRYLQVSTESILSSTPGLTAFR